MNNKSTTTTRTFLFGSGELLTLEQAQIENIPYLSALVSSANNFESIYNEHGHYKLDPHIEFKPFSFVIKSLSFQSVREIFTRLPKQKDMLAIIDLFDFLGIGPQPDPTFNEVDSAFFANLIYSPFLDAYLQVIRPSTMQDMAVRLIFAMVTEQYDLTDRQVIDQLYWFIMFILSAYKMFGPRLRHHVHTIAEHCFSLFSPSRLKSLKTLLVRTTNDTRRKSLTLSDKDVGPGEENKCSWEQELYPRYSYVCCLFRFSEVDRSRRCLFDRSYAPYSLYRLQLPFDEKKLLETIHERVLETMYERLQGEICQCRYAKKEINEWILFDILQRELVQEEIRNLILEEINALIPKLEKRHGKLMEEIRKYGQSQDTSDTFTFGYFLHVRFILEFGVSSFEDIQEEALSYELILSKLRQSSLIVEQIRQDVVKKLYNVALKQMEQWENTDQDIVELRQSLAFSWSLEKLVSLISMPKNQNYHIRESRPLPKIQRKYSTR